MVSMTILMTAKIWKKTTDGKGGKRSKEKGKGKGKWRERATSLQSRLINFQTQANDPSHNTPSGTSSANVFRARAYAPIIFQVEVSARITFLIGSSVTRDGYCVGIFILTIDMEVLLQSRRCI